MIEPLEIPPEYRDYILTLQKWYHSLAFDLGSQEKDTEPMLTWERLTPKERKTFAELAANLAAIYGGIVINREAAGRELFVYLRDYTPLFRKPGPPAITHQLALLARDPHD